MDMKQNPNKKMSVSLILISLYMEMPILGQTHEFLAGGHSMYNKNLK